MNSTITFLPKGQWIVRDSCYPWPVVQSAEAGHHQGNLPGRGEEADQEDTRGEVRTKLER